MFCNCGAKKSSVINSHPMDGYIKRQRRCASCGSSFHTKEELIAKPVIKATGLYTPTEAASIKMQRVIARRKNEDRVFKDEYE